MKVVFISNSCEHVVRPLCDGLYEAYGKDFLFIETKTLDKSRIGIGSEAARPYIFSAIDQFEEAKKLCSEADVVILGGVSTDYIETRIKENKLTLYYSERLFKRGCLRYLNPITMKHVKDRFITPSKNTNFHLLSASSFASLDFSRVDAFRNKMYKLGYQIEVKEKDIEALIKGKPEDGLSFIWVGRLVKVKHCDDAIKLIKRLTKEGYPARLTIIGTGDQEAKLKKLTQKLDLTQSISFKGICPIEETRNEMDKANIFLFTSDFGEGWGATLNEAMNSGCACIASHGAGSTYFLTEDKKDALIYKSGNIKMLYKKALQLIQNKELREMIGKNAYNKIYTLWNPKYSSKRMVRLIEELWNNGDCTLYQEGPCSKAEVVKPNWYKEKV